MSQKWHYKCVPKMRLDETSTRMIRAVRAEAARKGVSGRVLAVEALQRNPKYVYERYRFEKPFSTSDISTIANYLGIKSNAIYESAVFGEEIQKQNLAA